VRNVHYYRLRAIRGGLKYCFNQLADLPKNNGFPISPKLLTPEAITVYGRLYIIKDVHPGGDAPWRAQWTPPPALRSPAPPPAAS
jgi:hypothetical protein